MLSKIRIGVIAPLLLGGCASGGGYGDAPRLAVPPHAMIDAPAQRAYPPQGSAADPAASREGGYILQGEYQPEVDEPADLPPARSVPGARYAPPARGQVTVPALPPAPYRPVIRPAVPMPMDLPPRAATDAGPRGTSGETQRYDAVGFAGWYGDEMGNRTVSGQPFQPSGITAAHRTLPLGSFAEVTALDTGRTIVVLINDRGPGARDREIDLSRGAAQLLGMTAIAPVRVRLVTASPQDQMALRSGQPAGTRIDAPPALLTALRRKLPARAATAPMRPIAPALPRAAASDAAPDPFRPAPKGDSGLFVQVAALSNEGKAQALATSLQGRVQRIGAIYRVQIGPFVNAAAAQRARDDMARHGYGDARIVQTN